MNHIPSLLLIQDITFFTYQALCTQKLLTLYLGISSAASKHPPVKTSSTLHECDMGIP